MLKGRWEKALTSCVVLARCSGGAAHNKKQERAELSPGGASPTPSLRALSTCCPPSHTPVLFPCPAHKPWPHVLRVCASPHPAHRGQGRGERGERKTGEEEGGTRWPAASVASPPPLKAASSQAGLSKGPRRAIVPGPPITKGLAVRVLALPPLEDIMVLGFTDRAGKRRHSS